ncbi:hypothetical protein SKAU_G00299340 [Synaphobranchus kaupii]|uniref:Cyclic AMP-dependent transcription factor ATF-4 n=1 Tax=Synaphobranchus kaupii TaxID=118154 RepID=A0A9Q1EV91_SYNKA|nr:hypothetical protein SKAU_G00299340 [Synaphobranchus kaupii]
MASLVATFSSAVVDSIKEPLDSFASTDPFALFHAPSPHFSLSLSQPLLTDGHILDCKAGADLLSLPWLSADELPYGHISAGSSNEDAFSGMDWMAEKMDLSEFDLDSLMNSCASGQTPSSPDDLIASLESTVDLGLEPLPGPNDLLFPSSAPQEELGITLPDLPILPEPQAELEIKSRSPASSSPWPPSNIVLLLAPKEEPVPTATTAGPAGSESDSDFSSAPSSPCPASPPPQATGSSRTKPYSAPSPAPETPALTGRVKSAAGSGAPKVVEKKLKKMAQNKTAATRYRQKKRAEQEALDSECADLEQRNRELEEKAESISKEIQYLKDLIEEVRKAKSRKNKAAS